MGMFVRLRDWWRGYSDDDVRAAAEKMFWGWRVTAAGFGCVFVDIDRLSNSEIRAARSFPRVRGVSHFGEWIIVSEDAA